MKIALADLHAAMEFSKEQLVQLPTRVRLEGCARDLTEGERFALASLVGALRALGKRGIDTSKLSRKIRALVLRPLDRALGTMRPGQHVTIMGGACVVGRSS